MVHALRCSVDKLSIESPGWLMVSFLRPWRVFYVVPLCLKA